MTTYATTLIHRLKDATFKQVWFADDATAGGNHINLKEWWGQIVSIGPDCSYYPNTRKTWPSPPIVKEDRKTEATVTMLL